MPKKFDQDAEDRVVRLIKECILAEKLSLQTASQAVAPKLVMSWHTVCLWGQKARRDAIISRAEEDIIAENARLCRENQELRDTNDLLKAASAFFPAELDSTRRK
ncbi:transposase [Corynebacterium zhongnanshanii]|uniref:Transposase n=1 Tax=Corynebacterium zhongnanshanii TaxID=2768834 RepID=A0ABQ6VH27_9CORY|nr:transposase [Corynebacterium zhongnanshanii]